MKTFFKYILASLAALIVLGPFGSLIWYIGDGSSIMGYIAQGSIGLMGLAGVLMAFMFIALADRGGAAVHVPSKSEKDQRQRRGRSHNYRHLDHHRHI